MVRSDMYLLPSQLDVVVTLKPEEPRYVGIYAVPVYLGDVQPERTSSISPNCSLCSARTVSRYLW